MQGTIQQRMEDQAGDAAPRATQEPEGSHATNEEARDQSGVRLAAERVRELAAIIAHDSRQRKRLWWSSFVVLMAIDLLAISVLLLGLGGVVPLDATVRWGSLLAIILLPPGIGLGPLAYSLNVRPARREKRAVQELSGLDDLHGVGPLLDSVMLDNVQARTAAQAALAVLLPGMRERHIGLLTDRQLAAVNAMPRIAINPLLRRYVTTDYLIALIGCLGELGDERALPHVERLAERHAASEGDRRILAAAQECLPKLRERVARQRAAGTLLRPADAAADSLLRPAGTGPAPDSSALLRAASSEDMSGLTRSL